MDEKKRFVFYESFYDAIRYLSDEDRTLMLDAIIRYGLYEEMPELSGTLMAIFTLLMSSVDASKERYRKSRENGTKGGRPAKENLKVFDEKPNDNLKVIDEKPTDNLTKPDDNLKRKEKIKKRKDKENKREEKRRYGEFQNVLLTDVELEKLSSLFPHHHEKYIESLSRYLEGNPSKSYASHYLTIRNWMSRDGVKEAKAIDYGSGDPMEFWGD